LIESSIILHPLSSVEGKISASFVGQ